MKVIDKIVEYFYGRKIKTKNPACVKEIGGGKYYNVSIFTKLPFVKRYCVWSTYTKDINEAYTAINKARKNKNIVKDEVSLVEYIDRLWYYLTEGWLNVIDIINDDGNIIKKSKGIFKKPMKKWYCGFNINKRPFKPFNNDRINPILYINIWSLGWKPKYEYVCFEDNPQVWFCLFKFFWFGYKLVSPVKEDFEDSYWEQMIWFVDYCDCDLEKAEDTWYEKVWNTKYLIGKNKG